MKKIIALKSLIILFAFLCNQIFAQDFEWANQVELIAFDNVATILSLGHDVEKDADGNIYISGNFAGTQKFGDQSLTSSMIGGIVFTDDGFIAKYAPTGEFLWVEQFPASSLGNVYDIEIDASGNIYALMHFSDSISVMGNTIIADEAFVVAKMDEDLNLVWQKTITREGSQNFMFPGELELSNNDVIFTGRADDEVRLDGTILNEDFPVILVSLSQETGNLNWFDDFGFDSGDLATDASGQIYWVFNYPIAQAPNPVQLGNISINSTNGAVMVYAKYDAAGNIVSAKAFGDEHFVNPNQIQQVEVSSTGDIYLAGTWGDTLMIDGTQLVSSIASSTGGVLWLAKFNAAEELQWLKRSHLPSDNVSGNVQSPFIHIDAAPDGGVFISAEVTNNTSFSLGEGANEVSFENTVDGFVAKYNVDGNLAWGQKLDCLLASCNLYVRGLAAVDDDQAVLTGSFSHQFDLGNLSLTAVVPGTTQQANIYLVKVNGELMTSSTKDLPIQQDVIQLAPNPANDFVQLKAVKGFFENAQIEVIDLLGKVLIEESWKSPTQNISTNHLPNGNYFLKIRTKDFFSVEKIIVQR